jgi:hypothetical protein
VQPAPGGIPYNGKSASKVESCPGVERLTLVGPPSILDSGLRSLSRRAGRPCVSDPRFDEKRPVRQRHAARGFPDYRRCAVLLRHCNRTLRSHGPARTGATRHFRRPRWSQMGLCENYHATHRNRARAGPVPIGPALNAPWCTHANGVRRKYARRHPSTRRMGIGQGSRHVHATDVRCG